MQNYARLRSADLAIYDNQMKYNSYDYDTGKWNIDQSNDFPRLYPGNEVQGTVSGIAKGSHGCPSAPTY